MIPTVYLALLAVAEKQYRGSITGSIETLTSTVSLIEFASLDRERLLQSSPGPYRILQNLLLGSCSFRNLQMKVMILGSNLMLTKRVTLPN